MARKFKDKNDDSAPNTSYSMTLHDYLITNAPDVISSLPVMQSMPPVEYFSKLFEREKTNEVKRPGKDNGLVWLYAERIVYLARKFISTADDFKKLIIDARRTKIFWRGDEYDFFTKVVTETILFRDLEPKERDNYKKRIMTVAKSMGARHEMF